MSSQHINRYYVPTPSHWPIVGSFALLCMALGAVMLIHHVGSAGTVLLAIGGCVLTYMLFGWFGTVIRESERGEYNSQVDQSFRWSMSWFIFSEVMFFAAFFGALFYIRIYSLPWLSDAEHKILWPDFSGEWPSAGPAIHEAFSPMSAWGIPAINTLLLLTSGLTVTWAHWGLKLGNRMQLKLGLLLTILLGVAFIALQAYEYHEAAFSLKTGVYGSTFFMLTGFHGFHVTLGTIMLLVIFFRSLVGHFKPEHHFAFEAVSWYWHFVDVVWLILFVFVYWL